MLASIEYVKTILNGVKSWVTKTVDSAKDQLDQKVESIPQANQMQNDSTAKDYIQNRTHWAEETEEVAVSEEFYVDTDELGRIDFEELDHLNPNVQYKLIWDRTEYEVVFNSQRYYGYTRYWMGNGSIAPMYNAFAPATEDPFLLTPTSIFSTQPGSHSFKLIKRTTTIHPLPSKFLTDVESALTDNSRQILGLDFNNFFTTQNPTQLARYQAVYCTSVERTSVSGKYYVPTFYRPESNKILVIFSGSTTYYEATGSLDLKFANTNGDNVETIRPRTIAGNDVVEEDLPSGVTVLARDYSNVYLLNSRATWRDLPDKPDTQPLFIDPAEDGYSTTDTAYGDQIKYALLDGRNVWYFGEETDESGKVTSKYTKVSWFNIEKTDSEVKLIVGVGPRTDDNSGAVTFAITE